MSKDNGQSNSGLPTTKLNFKRNINQNTEQSDRQKEAAVDDEPISQTKDPQARQQGIPTSNPSTPSNKETFLAEFLDSNDDEERALAKVRNEPVNFSHQSDYTKVEDLLQKRIKKLREEFPGGGLNASRFINAEIFLEAPDDYFSRFNDDIKEITATVQTMLAEKGSSDLIGRAQQNPFDYEIQNTAFLTVHSAASELMKNKSYKGAERSAVLYMATADIIGMSQIDPLWNDKSVDEILINGPFDVQIEIKGQLHKVPSCSFRDHEHLEVMLERIFGTINKTLSPTTPYLDGRLYDQSRIAATHRRISPAGPNVSIRRHGENYWTAMDLVRLGTASEEMLTEVGNWINKGCSYIVIGGTGSGKELRKSTPVPTPLGWTTMGEIEVGDCIFDHHGKIGRTTKVFPQPSRQVYKLTLDNGEEFFAGADHNWWVSNFAARKSHMHRPKNNEAGRKREWVFTKDALENLTSLYEESKENDIITIPQLEKITQRKITKKCRDWLNEKACVNSKTNPVQYNAKNGLRWILDEYSNIAMKDNRRNRKPLYETKTTLEMLEAGVQDDSGRYQFSLPVLEKPVQYDKSTINKIGLEPNELPIHPYLLGLWLGDGSSSSRKFTAAPEDREDYVKLFEKLNIQCSLPAVNNSDDISWYIDTPDFQKTLRSIGILQVKAGESKKEIPLMYELASEESRRLITAGLIDSDGWANKNSPIYYFTNSNKKLIDGYFRIMSSLGYKTRINGPKNSKYKYNGKTLIGKDSWEVSILTQDELALLPRKNMTHNMAMHNRGDVEWRNFSKTIRSIEPLDEHEEMVCITVDSEDSTFLVGDGYTTTHNTSLLNATSGFFDESQRIVTMEDNLEMRLNPNKLVAAPMECIPANPQKPGDIGVTMRELVRASLRMRPDGIVIGEVRDGAMYDLCQALNTGHWGASTVHANSPYDGIYRMQSLATQSELVGPDQALPLIASAFDFIIMQDRFPEDGSRKITSVYEIDPRPRSEQGTMVLDVHPLWKFHANKELVDDKVVGEWIKEGDLSEIRRETRHLDLTPDKTWEELTKLCTI